PDSLEIRSIEDVRAADFVGARTLGGAFKPVAHAEIDGSGVFGFVGPAWVPAGNPFARLDGVANGVRLLGAATGELFFVGPGAGPDVTAQTILDDVIEVVRGASAKSCGE